MLFSEELLEIWRQPHWGHYWPLTSFLGDQNAWAAEKKYLCCIWASAHSVIKALSLFFVLIECTFSSIWTVQPRSDCPASASGLGWTTFRPWLTPVRPRKEKFLSRHEKFVFYFSNFWTFRFRPKEHLFFLTYRPIGKVKESRNCTLESRSRGTS